jgi:beta-mannosidase
VRAWWWFVADRDSAYPPARVEAEVATLESGRHRVKLCADGLVRDLSLFVDRLAPGAEVDRQLVTAPAGETIELVVTGLADVDTAAIAGPPVCRTANDLRR